ncbi:MAG: hypothetical protein RI964_1510, partial [Pseudomonadota bacterium]
AQAHLVRFRLGVVILPCRVLGLPFCQCPVVGKPRRASGFRKVSRLFAAWIEADFMADDHDQKDAVQRDICLIGGVFTVVIY